MTEEVYVGSYDSLSLTSPSLPLQIRLADLSEATNDPLAAKMRWRLRGFGIEKGVDVVYSAELPRLKLLPPADDEGTVRGVLWCISVRHLSIVSNMTSL
jgi:tRNA A37 threonylcarbamoyladenosine dehydratase